MSKSQISIIIPTKNEAANLPRLLRSISLSFTPPAEVIIIDNFSTDGTTEISIRTWKKWTAKQPANRSKAKTKLKTPNLKAGLELSQPTLENTPLRIFTQGPERSSQKNYGAKKAKSGHLLFLDADMELTPNLLKELNGLEARGNQAAVIPEYSVGHDFWGKAVALERNCYQNLSLLEAPRFFEKKLFLEIGGFDVSLVAGEDWDLGERLNQRHISILRTKHQLKHHEAKGFLHNLRRKWYYTLHIEKYANKHPALFKKQASLNNRLLPFWKQRRQLFKKPAHVLAFFFLKGVIYLRWKLNKQIS